MKLWQATFLLNFIFIMNKAYSFPDLTSPSKMNATWKASHTIPCTYQPSDEYVQEEIRWSKDGRIIIQRDATGDHIPVSAYRGKASIPSGPPGDVSLILSQIMLGDFGEYFCEVKWTSRATKEASTNKVHTLLKVFKVQVTKPVVIPSGPRYEVYEGEMLNLTCKSEGSPPIEYNWYKSNSRNQYEIVMSRLNKYTSPAVSHSDKGRYYCEARNSISGETYSKTSDELELVVLDKTTTTKPPTRKTSVKTFTTEEKTTTTNSPTRKTSVKPFTAEEKTTTTNSPTRKTSVKPFTTEAKTSTTNSPIRKTSFKPFTTEDKTTTTNYPTRKTSVKPFTTEDKTTTTNSLTRNTLVKPFTTEGTIHENTPSVHASGRHNFFILLFSGLVILLFIVIIVSVCLRRQKKADASYVISSVAYQVFPHNREAETCSQENHCNIYQLMEQRRENQYETITYAAEKIPLQNS